MASKKHSAGDVVSAWFNDPRTQRKPFMLPREAYDSLVEMVRRVRREDAQRLRAALRSGKER